LRAARRRTRCRRLGRGERKIQRGAERAAERSLERARKAHEPGSVSHLALLHAQQADPQAIVDRVTAQARRLAGTATLNPRLVGGRWNRADVAASASPKQVRASSPASGKSP